MLVKLLGIVDLVAAAAIIFSNFLPQKTIVYCAGYLIMKGGLFAFGGNIISILDVVCGIFILLIAFGFSFSTINIMILIFLLQKVIFSFI